MSVPPALLALAQRLPVFARLAPADRDALLDGADLCALPDGAVLIRQGDPPGRLYVLIEGHVALTLTRGRRRALIEILGPPALLGDAALFGDRPEIAEARAMGAARLIALPGAAFRARLSERFERIAPLLALTSMQLRARIRQIAALKLGSTAERLAGFVVSLAPLAEGAAVIRLPYDKRHVAELLGMTPESLSRALARLADLGVTAGPDGRLAVADLGRLRALVAEGAAP
jgi:CRP/FNR family transcriptional activator FtrB